ncbi:MAG: hypothetical protein GY826_09970, partial [Fuerstiella sp.]|nr:hypothetical protein [Fuerstiella sp.]
MLRIDYRLLLLIGIVVASIGGPTVAAADRPNVLFLICDDLNCDYTNGLSDLTIHAAHFNHCCPPPCPPGPPFC